MEFDLSHDKVPRLYNWRGNASSTLRAVPRNQMASSSVLCPPFGSFSAKYYSAAADGSCVRQNSFFEGKPVLNQGVGYSVILGFGAFFALFTSFLVTLSFISSQSDEKIAKCLNLDSNVNSLWAGIKGIGNVLTRRRLCNGSVCHQVKTMT
ncbi:hypothetical protein KFK09_008137 [Dendrobium nobile]|uniref:Uncharacterized protein n=1 Tax=Dendrobium nobile TaxID=94219 RepID=A0A8T3BW84_DENNO|nr:hypothetical protein KFK09_008137 [Dendrobium nobile]